MCFKQLKKITTFRDHHHLEFFFVSNWLPSDKYKFQPSKSNAAEIYAPKIKRTICKWRFTQRGIATLLFLTSSKLSPLVAQPFSLQTYVWCHGIAASVELITIEQIPLKMFVELIIDWFPCELVLPPFGTIQWSKREIQWKRTNCWAAFRTWNNSSQNMEYWKEYENQWEHVSCKICVGLKSAWKNSLKNVHLSRPWWIDFCFNKSFN